MTVICGTCFKLVLNGSNFNAKSYIQLFSCLFFKSKISPRKTYQFDNKHPELEVKSSGQDLTTALPMLIDIIASAVDSCVKRGVDGSSTVQSHAGAVQGA